ncbi:MAG: hypothetical protein A3J99_06945 [Sideroxydans sp. RIFOXYD2_FULL_59_7]|nr:MAG: hypothetical protein A3J99_06945 [Sideroxydans sp. RIFOXYD2_FULL_59_7]
MNNHKRIIGICWVVFGALILSLLLVNMNNGKSQVVVVGIVVGLTYLVAGFALLANFRRSTWICLPCSALSLFSFPVGTAIGLYYLWYYFKLEKTP